MKLFKRFALLLLVLNLGCSLLVSAFIYDNIYASNPPRILRRQQNSEAKNLLGVASASGDENDAVGIQDNEDQIVNLEVVRLKEEFLALAKQTSRGFRATKSEQNQIKDIVFELAKFNLSKQPARDYYEPSTNFDIKESYGSTISGKWTLIYTDAPDITGLDTTRNPFATAKLGRIGQECDPPYIKNVIEWFRPDWAKNLPFSGTDQSRVLQKVVTAGTSTPDKPMLVYLKVVGLELESGGGSRILSSSSSSNNMILDIAQSIQDQGIPAGLLSWQPLDLKGQWNLPFGQFEILYVDHDMRVIRTGQNYLAGNVRIQTIEDEWF